jgi:hypothetical protein
MNEEIELAYGTREVLEYLAERKDSGRTERARVTLEKLKEDLGAGAPDDVRLLEEEGVVTYYRGVEPGEGYVQLLPTYVEQAEEVSENMDLESIPRISHPPGDRELVEYSSTS